MKKCTNYEVEGVRPGGMPKKSWNEVIEKLSDAPEQICKEDAMDHTKWRKLII